MEQEHNKCLDEVEADEPNGTKRNRMAVCSARRSRIFVVLIISFVLVSVAIGLMAGLLSKTDSITLKAKRSSSKYFLHSFLVSFTLF